jgi:hypothetical protein
MFSTLSHRILVLHFLQPLNNRTLPCYQELVTLSSHPLLKSPEISNAGIHLSAVEFHSALQSAGIFFPFIIFFITGCDFP